MPTAFSRSMRSLEADGFRRATWGLLLMAALLGAWGAWFLRGRVTVYAVSHTARLEVERAAHPVAAPVAGRVIDTHLTVGREVRAGDVLVTLDDAAQRLQLAEERVRLTALSAQLGALHQEIAAEEEVWRDERHAARAALEEARARHREAEVAARSAAEEAELFARLLARALPAQLDLLRAQAEVHKRRAAVETLRLAVSRLEGDQRARESERKARLERLRREVTRLDGETATTRATVERLEHEIDRRRIRAPITGHLGDVGDLRVGAVVHEGEKLGAVVPPGDLTVGAYFFPPAALGRIQPGQPARLRLEGFPWTQYGAVAATVARVGNEPREGWIRVELTVDRQTSLLIPLQHGLPGAVEVEVERVSPATLVLRAVGKRLGAPRSALSAEGNGGGER
jgi:membrane fusion protein (multidrug efflux system)